ncbi:hypothetical protein R3P38DRAFT_2759857 [Favolaschia claudopus]|uniref:BTB domain-containing protein n=1 Tax=Favolaschia claudopus TaxID=2862362 RepID=A0AAW0E0F8_9AGAR
MASEVTISEHYLDTVVFKVLGSASTDVDPHSASEVEYTLFKVSRFMFERYSTIFSTTFSLPPSAEGAEGSSDANPFILEGISAIDFQRLLHALYPLTPIPTTPDYNDDEWISVLKLSCLWNFIEMRKLAIQRLDSYAQSLLDCVQHILFARRYDVSAWLRSGYTELAQRPAPVSSEEAELIGWETALKIWHLREAAVSPKFNHQPYKGVDIGNVFQAEFERADAAHDPLPEVPKFSGFRETREPTDDLGDATAAEAGGSVTVSQSGVPASSASTVVGPAPALAGSQSKTAPGVSTNNNNTTAMIGVPVFGETTRMAPQHISRVFTSGSAASTSQAQAGFARFSSSSPVVFGKTPSISPAK